MTIQYFLGKGEAQLSLSEETVRKLHETRSIVENIVEKGYVRYGINTGFGLLSKVVVESEKLVELQYNIVRFVDHDVCYITGSSVLYLCA